MSRRRSFSGYGKEFGIIFITALLLFSILQLPSSLAAENDIEMFTPNGGEKIIAGTEYRVQWTISTSGGYIAVLLSTNGGKSYDNIRTVANTPSHGYGWIDWDVPPNINSTYCKIMVVWTDSMVKPYKIYDQDESDANFTIKPGVSISFTESPSLVSYGRYYLCEYDLYDPYDMVAGLRFTWRTDDGSGWTSFVPLPGQYDWYDPNRNWIWWSPSYIESGYGEIKVDAMSKNNVSVLSTDTTPQFQIVSPATTLIQPDGGVTLVAGTIYKIKWHTSADPEEVINGAWLRYSTDGGSYWYTIAYTDNDFEYDWTVPSVSTTQLVVQIVSLYGEWYGYGDDQSSSFNTIITSASVPSVTLIDPNPPVDGGVVIGSGESYPIRYSLTGSSNIDSLQISYSIDGGNSYTTITTLTGSFGTAYVWTAPAVDTYEAKVRIFMSSSSYPDRTVISNHVFYIFDTIEFNRPPIAMVGPDQSANEGDVITLDGSGSYDQDGDPLTYTWTQVSPEFMDVTLSAASTAHPYFSVQLQHFPVNFVFELEVSDGKEHDLLLYNRDRVTVAVTPNAPDIYTFSPGVAWVGTSIKITGKDLMGAEVLFGNTVVADVSTDPFPGNPDPDHEYTFTLYDDLPRGTYDVKVRTMIGEDIQGNTIEIFPEPLWQFDNGLGFQNNHTHTLSYPWNPWGDGNYKDVFGNQVYLTAWICIGIPYWTPWTGWDCAGYLIDEPFAPDPLAAIFYGAVFHYGARQGECFGMSSTALKHYHGDVTTSHFGQGVSDWTDLERTGEMKRYVQEHQGAQMSSEILNQYLYSLINGLVPSSEYTGMGPWISVVKSSIDSGQLGIATMICDEGAHAVVPYAYDDMGDKIRFYVYDSNREEFSDPADAIWMSQHADPWNQHPPYIEIDRSGVYWDWSFEWVDGTEWSDAVGLAFVPYHVINGGRTLPLSVTGIINLLAGSADVSISDEEGHQVGVAENGSLLWEIEDAAPLPLFGGAGFKPSSYYLPKGNYTTHITGNGEGSYNWSSINNGSSAFYIEDAEVSEGSNDTVSVLYGDGNPYLGEMAYGSDDENKVYNGSIVHNYGIRYRTFKVKGAELNDDGEHGDGLHVLSTNEDYTGLVFTNAGGGTTTFDVEFTHNVMSEEVWNGTDRPGVGYLPTATRSGITVEPGETVIITPTNWLDLNNSLVLLDNETTPGPVQNVNLEETGGIVEISWDPPVDDGGWPVMEYEVHRGGDPGDLSLIASVNTTSFTDDTVERGGTYYYSVSALNAIGPGELSMALQIEIPLLTAPSPPLDLAGTLEENNVSLTWSEPEDDGGSPILEYLVFRGTTGDSMELLAEVGLETEYFDEGLSWNTTYYYRVAAVNALGQGAFSEIVDIQVPPKDTGPTDDDDDDKPVDDEDKGLPWWAYALIALVLLVLLILLFVFLRRGSGQPPPEE
ncbi:MAG: fibronectin type III domain-containing protein [Candidatus Thermoplasmatota archaeon]|nr:fibronectin type III domain-containing protein [Candidatus Thermoplasmatota archaeon]